MGRVRALGIAETAGAAMRSVASARLLPQIGIEGDRYAQGRGHWSGWPDAEVTFVDEAVPRELGVDSLALRRNVVTEGVDLASLVGKGFRIGEARLEGVRPCDPCRYLETLLARPGLTDALEGRGGLRARIVAAGVARVGDAIE